MLKFEHMAESKPPKTKTQLKSFLGMCNVCRRFIKGFSKTSFPLNARTGGNQPAELGPLTEEESEAFHDLKKRLQTTPILALPRPGCPCVLDTDASDRQLGCTLLQEQPDGTLHPIGCWSRSLNQHEKNCSPAEKECLAVVWAVIMLRPCPEQTRFTVRTDHQPLKWLMTLSDPQGRLARWRLRLLEFDIEIQCKPGVTHALADYPSRVITEGLDRNVLEDDLPVFPNNQHRSPVTAVTANNAHLPERISLRELLEHQASDTCCCWARKELDSGRSSLFSENQNGVLLRTSPLDNALQVLIPDSLKDRLLHIHHYAPSSGHPGTTRMHQTLRRDFCWPKMAADVHACVGDCSKCAKNRIKGQGKKCPMKLFPAHSPVDCVAVDILGPLPRTKHGNRFIPVITDRFSKLTQTVPVRTTTALKVAEAFCNHWVFHCGPPKKLLTDNGSQFTSKFLKRVCKTLGISKVFTTEHHPQTNGQTERHNRTTAAQLRDCVSDSQKDWDEWLGSLTCSCNSQVHKSTGVAPFELTLTRKPPSISIECEISDEDLAWSSADRKRHMAKAKAKFLLTLEGVFAKAKRKLAKAQAYCKKAHDRKVKPRKEPVKPGSYVFRHVPEHPAGVNPKLAQQSEGPCKVLRNDNETAVIDTRGNPITSELEPSHSRSTTSTRKGLR